MKRGMYFNEPKNNEPLFTYEEVCNMLPEPITDNSLYLDVYHYTVKVAFKKTQRINPQTKLHSNFQDSAFNQNLFLWDSCFIARYLSAFEKFLPGIKTLNNFYALQLEDGLIPREVNKYTGDDYQNWVNNDSSPLHSAFHLNYIFRGIKVDNDYQKKWYPNLGRTVKRIPYYTLDNLNHPLLVYAEYYHYLHTGNTERLEKVHESLYHHYLAFKEHLRHKSGLYVTDWASMDNSPRNEGLLIGCDISSEMALFCRLLIEIYRLIDLENQYEARVKILEKDYDFLVTQINQILWNEKEQFYYDLNENFQHIKIKTLSGFFTLLAGITNQKQTNALVHWLKDKKTFNRIHSIPTVAANEKSFNPNGGYWSGGVWAPTNLIVIDGLEYVGEHELAKHIALQHLAAVAKVFQDTGTIWENYPADSITKGDSDKADFIGWSGIAPILFLFKYHIGLFADARTKKLYFNVNDSLTQSGIKQFSFLNKLASITATKNETGHLLSVETKDSFPLEVRYKNKKYEFQVTKNQTFQLV